MSRRPTIPFLPMLAAVVVVLAAAVIGQQLSRVNARLDRLEQRPVERVVVNTITHDLSLPARASRSESRAPKTFNHRDTLKASLNWSALAQCESSGNPRAVNSSGKYGGAFQMDAAFWRTYGGLTYATRPDLATYAQQLAVAQRGYAARGRSPWPSCGRRL